MQLFLINTASEADFIIRSRLDLSDAIAAFTRSGFNDYFNNKYGNEVPGIDLSVFIDRPFMNHAYETAHAFIPSAMNTLDRELAYPLVSKCKLPKMAFFKPLYNYVGKLIHMGTIYLYHGLARLMESEEIGKVVVFEPYNPNLFIDRTIPYGVVDKLCKEKGIPYEVLQIPPSDTADSPKNKIPGTKYRTVKNLYRRCINRLTNCFNSLGHLKTNSRNPRVLLIEPLYDLSFVAKAKNKYRFIPINPKNFSRDEKISEEIIDSIMGKQNTVWNNLSQDQLFSITLKDIRKDFSKNIATHLGRLQSLDNLNKEQKINVVMWGIPPTLGFQSLVVEYFKAKGIPVIGSQHGGNYAVVDYKDLHFDSDFSRCDVYLSYGFDAEDLARIYPDKHPECSVIPVGSYKEQSRRKKNKIKGSSVDILFPITNSVPLISNKLNTPGYRLYSIHREIIEYLETLNEYNIYIKPFKNFNESNCSVFRYLETLKNVKISRMTLTEFYEKCTPRLAIFEHPLSAALYESLGRDMEIFLITDWLPYFDAHMLSLIKQRIYIFESVEEVKRSIRKFLNGELQKRRDQTFYRRYFYRKGIQKKCFHILEDLTLTGSLNIDG